MSKKMKFKKVQSEEKRKKAEEKKIQKVFEKLERKGMSVKSSKAEEKVKLLEEETGEKQSHKHLDKANEEKSYARYKSQVKTFLEKVGVNEVKDITPDVIENYVKKEIALFSTPIIIEQDGEKTELYPKEHMDAAGRLNNSLSALKAFQLGLEKTSALSESAKKQIDFGDIQKYRDMVKESNVFRPKDGSAWENPTNRQMRTIRERLEKKYEKSQNPLDKLTADFVEYCRITGSRPTNGASQVKKNIHKNSDGSLTVTHYRDKGDKTRYVTITDKKDIEKIEELMENAKGEKLFQAYKKNGKYLSNDSFLKRAGEIVSSVTEDMKGTKTVKVKGNKHEFTVETRITLHSFRKNFATNVAVKTYEYYKRNPRETEKRILESIERLHQIEVDAYNRYKKENPPKTEKDRARLKKLEPISKRKYQDLVDAQNEKNRKNAMKKGNKTYKKVKTLSSAKSAQYTASALLGHHRCDVVVDSYLHPTTWNKVIEKYKK